MRVDNRIVFMDGMFPAIFFPVGLPENGGSCAYLTEQCLKYCPAHETNEHEIRALKYFEENTVETIVRRIIDELCLECLTHLYWWPWGDCLPEMTDKIINVMLNLSKAGVLQNGYTRNGELFLKLEPNERLKIGFHVDRVEKAQRLSKEMRRVICCPDVTVGKAELYFNGEKVARCCGIWCEWLPMKEVRLADCQECYLNKQGCFIQ